VAGLAQVVLPGDAALFEQIRVSAIALAHHFPRIDPRGTALLNAIIETCKRGVLLAEPRPTPRGESLDHTLNAITNMLTVTLGHVTIAKAASPAHVVNRSEELEYACQAAELGVSAALQLAALLRLRA
jgi:hypothetical protein